MKTAKQDIVDYIGRLPDDASMETILEGLATHLRIKEAIVELDRGEGIPHEEVMESLDRWVESLGRGERRGILSS